MKIVISATACDLCHRLSGHEPTCTHMMVRLCDWGLHSWAWLTTGGQECVICGARQ